MVVARCPTCGWSDNWLIVFMACSEQAAACEEDPDCIRLEACFQRCFTLREGNCINRCLQDTGISRNSPTVQIREPLFQCGRRAGCYGAQAGGMNMNGPMELIREWRVLRNIPTPMKTNAMFWIYV